MSNIYAHWGNPIIVYKRDDLNGGNFITSEVPCSNCGYTVPVYKKTLFCAGCGAKMNKENEEKE